jgi:hypothetical protein
MGKSNRDGEMVDPAFQGFIDKELIRNPNKN